jgi:diguanylate cyclase (GGDEF)-like protein
MTRVGNEVRTVWTAEELKLLKEFYPSMSDPDIAARVGHSVQEVRAKAHRMQLRRTSPTEKRKTREEVIRIADGDVVDLRFVAGEAGDIEIQAAERQLHDTVRAQRGDAVYVDMLLALTTRYFPVETAPEIWKRILQHRAEMNSRVGRNVGVSVAALDYFSNMDDGIGTLTLIPERRKTAMARVAIEDGLTALYDHATFKTMLRNELHRFERYGEPVSLIMLDIDHFKAFNDTYGHQAGDRVLVEVGNVILETIRDIDIAARYGGEEFAVILPHTASGEAFAAGERIRKGVDSEFRNDSHLTVSAGVATCPTDATDETRLLKAADMALYRSKCGGRNRTTYYGERNGE